MLLSLICGVNYFGCCLSTLVSFPFFYNSTLTIPFEGCRLLFTGGVRVYVCETQGHDQRPEEPGNEGGPISLGG